MVETNTSLNNYFKKVFLWMFLGLIITFGTALTLSTIAIELFMSILLMPFVLIIIVILQLGLVFGISFLLNKLDYKTTLGLFLLYSFISGITFTALFLVFAIESILFVFGLTALLFALLALIGYTTKKDLSSLGPILMVTLIGLILALVINIFLQNTMFDLIISIIAVILFMGLTVFDMQKLKKIAGTTKSKEDLNKIAVFGALTLYLDFINLFINLLKLFGDKR